MAKGAIRVDWFPSDALDGMKFLTPMEELAYRRIIDLIYISGGFLPDDDEIMGEQSRCFSDWPKIKLSLKSKGKIMIRHGMITNQRCMEILGEIEAKVEKARAAGLTSGRKRRELLTTKSN